MDNVDLELLCSQTVLWYIHGQADPWWISHLDSLFSVVNLYQTGPIFRNWDNIKNGHYINSYFAALAAPRH